MRLPTLDWLLNIYKFQGSKREVSPPEYRPQEELRDLLLRQFMLDLISGPPGLRGGNIGGSFTQVNERYFGLYKIVLT